MWNARTELIENGRVLKAAIDQRGVTLRYSDVVQLWQNDADFQSFYSAFLADAPFSAYRWETPPLTAKSAHRPFEFVMLDSPGLASKPDRNAFASYFPPLGAEEEVVVFPNLGKDAVLVVPCPNGPDKAYRHIAAFVREAPMAQKHALWKAVGQALAAKLGSDPVWLSTAGAGVAWLHVRLDSRPKYYGFAPYKKPA